VAAAALSPADAVALKMRSSMLMLNDPAQKKETRIAALKAIADKLEVIDKKGLLKDEATLKQVTDGIAYVMKNKETMKQTELDKKFDSIRADIEKLKKELIARAQQLQGKMDQSKQNMEIAETSGVSAKEKAMEEKIFDELLEVQDAPVAEQLKVLSKFKGALPVVEDMLTKEFKENANIAMEFGQALDEQKSQAYKKAQEEKLKKLEKDAHLQPAQAKNIMPILANLDKQRAKKHQMLRALDMKIHQLESTERFYQKQRASYLHEEKTLDSAVEGIEHGDLKKIQVAMKELGKAAALL